MGLNNKNYDLNNWNQARCLLMIGVDNYLGKNEWSRYIKNKGIYE